MTTEQIEPGYIRERKRHWKALEELAPKSGLNGLAIWRKLRRLEVYASEITTALCNGEIEQDDADLKLENITLAVCQVLRRPQDKPCGFFINRDPRGYALKMEEGTYPEGMHTDWGRYGILAPLIDKD